MDALARDAGGKGPWPSFANVQIAAIAEALGCSSRRITGLDELLATFDEVLPGLPAREEPLLLEVVVSP